MTDLDRREFLRLAGAGAGAAAVAGAGLAPADALIDATASGRVSRRALRELRREIAGRVLIAGEKGYDGARLVYNERYDRITPAAVVRVRGVRDVKTVVRWANRRDVRITARCGGHSYAGYSTNRNGVVVDLRDLQRITTSNGKGTATVAAGVALASMYTRLARKGLTVPGGTCPTVGISGLALGGGVGMASRKLGLTCDNIRSLGIVLPDGRWREVDRRRHPDLFWACRGGGGGNFGIVTHFTFDAHPVERAAYFHIRWPEEQAEAAFDAWQNLVPDAPPALMSVASLRAGKRGPKFGGNGQLFGSERRLRSLIAPLTAIDGAELEIGTEAYGDLMLRWAGCEGESVATCLADAGRSRFYASSDYAASPLGPAGRRRLLAAAAAGESLEGSASLILDAYGGAINRVAPDATAFVHRDQAFGIQYFAEFAAGGRRAAIDWVEGARRTLRPDVSGGSYQNYIDPRQRGWKRAYYGDNWERLRAVKTAYDPDDRFRFRQGIPPKG